MKIRALTSIIIANVLMLTAISTSARDLTGVTVEWSPHYGSAMTDGGALTVITKEAFRRAGHNAKVSYIAWNRALKNVEEGQDDFVMGAYYNEERAKTYIFSDSIYSVDLGAVALSSLGFNQMSNLRSLEPYTIGVSLGYANTEEFDAAEYLTKENAPSPKLNIRKLFRNRVDLVVGAFDILRYEARVEELDVRRMVFVQPPLQSNALYLLISRAISDGQQIVDSFNLGLAEMKKDGTLNQILKQYLNRS